MIMCQINNYTQTLYECPFCHYKFNSREKAQICIDWHNETQKVMDGFNSNDLIWYELQCKHNEKNIEIMPYVAKQIKGERWGYRDTCQYDVWALYDTNYAQYYTQENWIITGTKTLEEMWQAKRLLPHMKNISDTGRIKKLNKSQLSQLYGFWDNTIINTIREKVYTGEYTNTLGKLIDLACSVIAGEYYHANCDPVPEFDLVCKRLIEANYKLGD